MLSDEFLIQVQQTYGLDPNSGELTPLDHLDHLDHLSGRERRMQPVSTRRAPSKCSRIQGGILYMEGFAMTITAQDIVSLTTARAQLSELAEQVKAGAEKIITKNGEGYVALVDAHRLDYYHRLEQAHLHLLMLDQARRGLEDVAAGRTRDARDALAERKQARSRA